MLTPQNASGKCFNEIYTLIKTQVVETEAKIDTPITHIYMIVRSPGEVQTLY